MTATERLEAYADLAIHVGANLAPGQELLIETQVDHAPMARALAVAGYRAGASRVDTVYNDPHVRRALVAHGPDPALEWAPPWTVARIERAVAERAAIIATTSGGSSVLFGDLDPARVARARPLAFQRAWYDALLGGGVNFAIIACATDDWATEVFGVPDRDRLWEALGRAMRLDEPDPAAAWSSRLDELQRRAAMLTERRFDAIRYRGPGTDLEVGLIEGALWLAGRVSTTWGWTYTANLPTEEVFTSPHRLRAEGTVRCSKPLDLTGTRVEGLELRFAGGRIVEVNATLGADAVRTDLATDEQASRLGELALVDRSSRVGQGGVVFRNTLLDENAASHIAWGQALPWVLPEASAEERAERGLNGSATHIDVMIGCDELEVDGIELGGGAVPLMRGGAFALEV